MGGGGEGSRDGGTSAANATAQEQSKSALIYSKAFREVDVEETS
jgi:hypothetical protein